MASSLSVLKGPASGEQVEVDGELTIGRHAEGLGKLGDDSELSRRHARFHRTPGGQLTVEDLGSTNGTLVNGTRITGRVDLGPGDRVELGQTVLKVTPSGAAPPPRPAPAAAAAPLAGAGATAQPAKKKDLRVPILGLLLLFCAAGLVVALVSGGDEGSVASEADGRSFDGTVYVLSNRKAPRGNAVLAFKYGNGSLYPMRMAEYPTDGTGGDAHDSNLALDGDQQVWLNEDRTLLFAVNMGSDSVAVFRVGDDGSLTPVSGSPFPSGGVAPISIGISDGTAVVVNKGFDGVRTKTARPSITQFKISEEGKLSPIGRPIQLQAGSNPTQAQAADDGRLFFVSELIGARFTSLVRQDDGSYRAGPVTPITDEDRRFGRPPGGPPGGGGGPPADAEGGPPPDGAPSGEDPSAGADGGGAAPAGGGLPMGIEGLVAHPSEPVVYSEVPTFSEVLAHSYDKSGKLKFESGQFVPNGLLVCWAEITPDGRFLYIAATATNRVAVFDLKDPRRPRRIQNLELKAGPSGPINLRLDESGERLFVLGSGASDEDLGTHRQIHALNVGSDGRLSEKEEPLELPVPVPEAGPMGLVVVPRR